MLLRLPLPEENAMPAKKKKVTAKKSKKTKTKKTTSKVKSKKTATKKAGSKAKKKTSPKKVSKKQTKTKQKRKVKTKTKPKTTKAKTKGKTTKEKAKKTTKIKPKTTKKVETKKVAETSKPNGSSVAILEVVEPTKYKVKSSATIVGSLNFTPYHLRKGEEYMNPAQLKHFENILWLWKQQLMYEVDSTVGHMKEDVMSYPDPLDRASQEEGFNLELRTRDRERKLIKKIEQALDMIKNGEYGYCEDCGAEIGIRRLEARPTADKCIDCKTYEEIREKQVGGQ